MPIRRLCAAVLLAGLSGAWAAGEAGMANLAGQPVCPAPDSACVLDREGQVICSKPGGAIAFDRYGDPVCGPGYCASDIRGDLWCSSAPRGAASIDRYGAAVCSESCVAAAAQACVKPVPAR